MFILDKSADVVTSADCVEWKVGVEGGVVDEYAVDRYC
jgi:hypothetical protein